MLPSSLTQHCGLLVWWGEVFRCPGMAFSRHLKAGRQGQFSQQMVPGRVQGLCAGTPCAGTSSAGDPSHPRVQEEWRGLR